MVPLDSCHYDNSPHRTCLLPFEDDDIPPHFKVLWVHEMDTNTTLIIIIIIQAIK